MLIGKKLDNIFKSSIMSIMRPKRKVKRINLYLTERQIKGLWDVSKRTERSFAEVSREAIDRYLDEQKK